MRCLGRYPITCMHRIGTPGSQTPGVPVTPEPSTPNNCWPWRAPKKCAAGTQRPNGRSPKNEFKKKARKTHRRQQLDEHDEVMNLRIRVHIHVENHEIRPNFRRLTQGTDCQIQGTRKRSVHIFKCGRRDDLEIQVHFHLETPGNSSKSLW